MKEKIVITDNINANKRLDKFLAEELKDFSRGYIQSLIKTNNVKVNNQVKNLAKTKVNEGDEVKIILEEDNKKQMQTIKAEKEILLDIIYEDKQIIVINKPRGLVVHPAPGNIDGTLVNALMGRNTKLATGVSIDELRPGIVHRLDKDTSGCVVVAKTVEAYLGLTKAFKNRTVQKEYATIVCGTVLKRKQRIITMIDRHPVNRKKMAVVPKGGRQAITEYTVMSTGEIDGIKLSTLAVKIMTGRTHQIRVHLAHIKHPVLGDKVYGGKQALDVPRQMLHAFSLTIQHPTMKKAMTFEAPFPKDFEKIYNKV